MSVHRLDLAWLRDRLADVSGCGGGWQWIWVQLLSAVMIGLGATTVAVAVTQQAVTVPAPTQLALENGQMLRFDASAQQLTLDVAGRQLRRWQLLEPRSGAHLTRLADGRVLVWGGVDARGQRLSGGYVIDPPHDGLTVIALRGILSNLDETATLLSDGRILWTAGSIGTTLAAGESSAFLPSCAQPSTMLPDGRIVFTSPLALPPQLWNPVTQAVTTLYYPRQQNHWQCRSQTQSVTMTWAFQPENNHLQPVPPLPPGATVAFALAATYPTPALTAVDPRLRLMVRLTQPIEWTPLFASIPLFLEGPSGRVAIHVVVAEGGLLLFIQPEQTLLPDSFYTLVLDRLHGRHGQILPLTKVTFKTRVVWPALAQGQRDQSLARQHGCDVGASPFCLAYPRLEHGAWRPGRANIGEHWRLQDAQPFLAVSDSVGLVKPIGTAVTGQVLQLDQHALAGVVVRIGAVKTRTDRQGRFVLSPLPAGHQILQLDATSGRRADADFGQAAIGVDLTDGVLTRIAHPIYLARLGARDRFALRSPLATDQIMTHPDLPGLEIQLPAATVIRDGAGQLVTQLTLVPTPVNRAATATPANFSGYFTLGPVGSTVTALPGAQASGLRLILPNYAQLPTHTRVTLWADDPDKGWHVWGSGEVSAEGGQILPDAGVRLHTLAGVGWTAERPAVAQRSAPCLPDDTTAQQQGLTTAAGGVLDFASGDFRYHQTDVEIAGLPPITVARLYRPHDTTSFEFGRGTVAHFHYSLTCSSAACQQLELMLPTGGTIVFQRQSGSGLLGRWRQTDPNRCLVGAAMERTPTHGYTLTLRDGRVLQFNATMSLQLQWTRDRFGNETKYQWDGGLLMRISQADGRFVTLSYDADNRIQAVRDPLGHVWSYRYDQMGFLHRVTRPDGSMSRYTYAVDPAPLGPSPIQRQGQAAKSMILADATLAAIENNGQSVVQIVAVSVPAAASSALARARLGSTAVGLKRVSRLTFADGTSIQLDYRAFDRGGNDVVVTFADRTQRRLTFDPPHRRVVKVIDADGTRDAQTTLFERSPDGRLRARIDPLGRRTAYRYDAFGRVTDRIAMAGRSTARTTHWQYAVTGDVISRTDAMGQSVHLAYAHGCLNRYTDALGQTTQIQCNPEGRPIRIDDPLGHSTHLRWAGSDLLQITDALGRSVHFRYDGVGHRLAASDDIGQTVQWQYDALGRVVATTQPGGRTLRRRYHPTGTLGAIQSADGASVTMQYDPCHRLLVCQRSDGVSARWSYDAMGRLVSATDGQHRTTLYRYDDLGQLVGIAYPNQGGTVHASYDGAHRLLLLVDSQAGIMAWNYDDFDAIIAAQSATESLRCRTDALGRRQWLQLAGQAPIALSYRGDQLVRLSQASHTWLLRYDAAGRLTMIHARHHGATAYVYNDANDLIAFASADGTGKLKEQVGFRYNRAGQCVARLSLFSQPARVQRCALPLPSMLAWRDSVARPCSFPPVDRPGACVCGGGWGAKAPVDLATAAALRNDDVVALCPSQWLAGEQCDDGGEGQRRGGSSQTKQPIIDRIDGACLFKMAPASTAARPPCDVDQRRMAGGRADTIEAAGGGDDSGSVGCDPAMPPRITPFLCANAEQGSLWPSAAARGDDALTPTDCNATDSAMLSDSDSNVIGLGEGDAAFGECFIGRALTDSRRDDGEAGSAGRFARAWIATLRSGHGHCL